MFGRVYYYVLWSMFIMQHLTSPIRVCTEMLKAIHLTGIITAQNLHPSDCWSNKGELTPLLVSGQHSWVVSGLCTTPNHAFPNSLKKYETLNIENSIWNLCTPVSQRTALKEFKWCFLPHHLPLPWKFKYFKLKKMITYLLVLPKHPINVLHSCEFGDALS